MVDAGTVFGIAGVAAAVGEGVFTVVLHLNHQRTLDKVTYEMKSQTDLQARARDIASNALSSVQMSRAETEAARNEKYVELLANLRAIETTLQDSRRVHDLISEGLLIGGADMAKLEGDLGVEHVWMMTPDLEPDLSDKTTRSAVKENRARGINYFYVCPSSVSDGDVTRLTTELSVDNSSGLSDGQGVPGQIRVEKVTIGTELSIFGAGGNRIILFYGRPGSSRLRVYDEVVLDNHDRGSLWRPRVEEEGRRTYKMLEDSIQGLE